MVITQNWTISTNFYTNLQTLKHSLSVTLSRREDSRDLIEYDFSSLSNSFRNNLVALVIFLSLKERDEVPSPRLPPRVGSPLTAAARAVTDHPPAAQQQSRGAPGAPSWQHPTSGALPWPPNLLAVGKRATGWYNSPAIWLRYWFS